MTRPLVLVAAGAYAVVDAAVILAPAVVLAAAAEKGGVSGNHGLDLLVASGVVAAGHAGLAFRRLTSEARGAERKADVWIAALDALVVLAIAVTLLLLVVLGGFADQHDVLVNDGWPVIALWLGVQLTAVAAAEAVGWWVFRWLEPPPRQRALRRQPAAWSGIARRRSGPEVAR